MRLRMTLVFAAAIATLALSMSLGNIIYAKHAARREADKLLEAGATDVLDALEDHPTTSSHPT